MPELKFELAGVSIAADVLFETTLKFCSDYLTDVVPLERVAIDRADIEAERARVAERCAREGRPTYNWSDNYLETFVLYRKVAMALLPYNAIVFHGAVVALDGRAYLFTARSGTGKTTHVRFWLSQIPGSYILNGDKPLLRVIDGGVLACGTPWQGKEHMGVNERLPLAGLCVLERGKVDAVRRVDIDEVLPTLIRQTHRPEEPATLVRIMELVGAAGETVPLWRMSATLDERSALVSHDAMVRDKLT